MKKLFTLLSVALTFGAVAQSVVMTEIELPSFNTLGAVGSGDTILINTTVDHYDVPIRLTFSGVASGNVNFRVKEIQASNCFTDQICGFLYPDVDFQSNCWSPNNANYTTPMMNNVNFAAGDTVLVEPKGSMTCGGCSQHRYYIRLNGSEIDSFDLKVCTTLSAPSTTKEELNIAMYPNPASSYVTLNATGIDGMMAVRITDMLGKVVYDETIPATKKLDVSDFKNGVYLVSVSDNGKLLQTKRLVIKH